MIDLQVFAAPRITLKPLVPSFPCFANISVSLMDKVCDHGYIYLPILLRSMSDRYLNMFEVYLLDWV